MTYAESTKQRIVQYVLNYPGHKGGEIALALGLDKSRVNSFLYSEGKRRFRLQESNWRWSASEVNNRNTNSLGRRSSYVSTVASSGITHVRRVPVNSICGSLSRLGVTDATLKIRGMNEHQINLAFAEDDYPLLDDRLQAEMAMRRSELLGTKPAITEPTSPLGNPLVFIALGVIAVIFLGNVMNNSSINRAPQRSLPSSVR